MPDITCTGNNILHNSTTTTSQITAFYSSQTTPSPAYYIITSGSDSLDREANGKLTTIAMQNYITTSPPGGPKLPAFSPPDNTNTDELSKNLDDDVKSYLDNQKRFADNINSEYEFYYCRYKYALNQFLTLLKQKASTNSEPTNLDSWLGATRTLNKRLNDLYQIYTYIGSYALSQYSTAKHNISSIETQINKRNQDILKEGELLSRTGSDTELYNKMVEYTKEKAKATNNLISLYACMNLIAIGMLFYVYKAT
jgi:hypothetical protein